MSNLDVLIQNDLGALEVETARVGDFDTVTRDLGGTGPYRDGAPGAEARRRELTESRLCELALMPRAAERVFVHRVSRAAAGGAALLGVGFLTLASMDPWAERMVFALFGRLTPALAAALLGGAVLAAYVVAGLIAERVYDRNVRSFFRSSDEPVADGQRMASLSPTDDSVRLIDRVDAAAIALPLAGLIASGLLLGLLLFFSAPRLPTLALLSESRDVLVPAVLLATIGSLVIGGACARARREIDVAFWGTFGQHWSFLAVGLVSAVAALWYAVRTAFGLHTMGIIPSVGSGMVLATLGLLGLGMPAVWLLLWQRRREYQRLDR